jgi:uncharacterized protein (TIGR00661 family)
MHCKVYLSDEGHGHIVRQRAVVEALLALKPELEVTIQTKVHIRKAEQLIPHHHAIDKFNNIRWDKQEGGSPDLKAIQQRFDAYIGLSEHFIEDECSHYRYDFLLSDFVYEAFEIGRRQAKPAFGIAHFTWDWFFSKLYPPPIHSEVMSYFLSLMNNATRLYFPPFTPRDIIQHHKDKALQVPFILNHQHEHKVVRDEQRFNVLIIDSGAGVLERGIRRSLKALTLMDDFIFYVSENYTVSHANIRTIPSNELMVDYIVDMDLVIGRAGFNTISECIGLRTPMLLIGEEGNPEMMENLLLMKKENLASFISMKVFEEDLDRFLPFFVKYEYKLILQAMRDHAMATNGADIIAADILDRL